MRIEPTNDPPGPASAATVGASAEALNRAMPRSERLRALVRSHQHLVEHRSHLRRSGAPPDPQIESDVAAITERITNLLSNREERPVFKRLMRPGIEHHIEEPLRET